MVLYRLVCRVHVPCLSARCGQRFALRRGVRLGLAALSITVVLPMSEFAGAAEPITREELFHSPAARAFKEGDFEEATDGFEQMLKSHPDDATLLLNLASSLRELGRYKDAEKALLKAKAVKPDSQKIYYYLGLTYYDLGQPERAIKSFEQAIKLDPDSRYAQDARRQVQLIALHSSQGAPANSGRPWSAYGQLGVEYDDNVNAGHGKQADGAFRLTQFGDFGYRLNVPRPWTINAGMWAYQAENLSDNVDDLNLTAVSPSLSVSYATTINDVAVVPGVAYRFEADWLGGDYYGQLHEIRPNVVVHLSDRLQSLVYNESQFERYDDEGEFSPDTSRDAFSNKTGMRQYIFFNDRQDYVTIALDYKYNDADGKNFNYDRYGFELGASFQLPWTLRLGMSGRYEREEHNDFQSSKDLNIDRQIVNISLAKKITENVSMSVYYWFRNDEANVQAFDYKRHIGGMYLSYKF